MLNLNKKQKVTVWVGLLMILLSFLFPPLHYYLRSGSETVYWGRVEFRFILDPPEQVHKGSMLEYFTINFRLLYTRMFVIAIITAGLALTFQEKRQNDYLAVNTKDEDTEP